MEVKIGEKNSINSNHTSNKDEDLTIINIDYSGNSIQLEYETKKENKNENNEENCCMVCLDIIGTEDLENYKIECGHKFCKDCWLNYLNEKINSNEDILCMEKTCLKNIKDERIRYFLKDNNILLKKYKNNILKRKIYNNPNKKFCPYPNCDGIGEIINFNIPNNKFIKCSKGHEFCFVCLKKWHKGKKCKEEIIDKNLKKWKNKENSKRCPNCGIILIKNNGCNHMKCTNCKYDFCWFCMNKYTDNHLQISSCFQNKEWKICNIKIIRYIYNFFYIIALYLFYCLFSFPNFLINSADIIDKDLHFYFCIMIYFPLFVAFEIFFFCLVFIFLLSSIFYPKIFYNYDYYINDIYDKYRKILGY